MIWMGVLLILIGLFFAGGVVRGGRVGTYRPGRMLHPWTLGNRLGGIGLSAVFIVLGLWLAIR